MYLCNLINKYITKIIYTNNITFFYPENIFYKN